MEKIKIIRNNEYNNKYRKISIFLNNIKIGEIANNEEFEFEVSKNNNVLLLKLDWVYSQPYELEKYLPKYNTFRITSAKSKHKNLKIVCAIILFLLSPFLSEFNDLGKIIFIICILYLVIDLLRLFYSMTKFSSKKYLELEPIN